jgi:hypothetical protein
MWWLCQRPIRQWAGGPQVSQQDWSGQEHQHRRHPQHQLIRPWEFQPADQGLAGVPAPIKDHQDDGHGDRGDQQMMPQLKTQVLPQAPDGRPGPGGRFDLTDLEDGPAHRSVGGIRRDPQDDERRKERHEDHDVGQPRKKREPRSMMDDVRPTGQKQIGGEADHHRDGQKEVRLMIEVLHPGGEE